MAPRVFKSKLARFAPQFSGYNQHDSQVSEVNVKNGVLVFLFCILGCGFSMVVGFN